MNATESHEANVGLFFACLRALDLPPPEREIEITPKRKWRIDFAWPAYKLALEVEGGLWTHGRHTRGKGFMDDMVKYNTATLLGWRVLRCTPKALRNGEAAKLIEAALRDSHSRHVPPRLPENP